MRHRIRVIVLGMLLAASSTAQASQFTGNELQTLCEGENGDDFACLTFVFGAYQSMVMMAQAVSYKTKLKLNENMGICFREDVTRKQVNDVFLSYLKNHPENRDSDASVLVLRALKEGFPCE